MYKTLLRPVLLTGLVLATTLGVAHADEDPMKDPSVQKTLRAMANASTWYHPDQFGEFAGMRLYTHHHYKEAMKYFEIGAFYADKLSQLCVGLMYLNGEGVTKDPATAYAWLGLAAERQYPEFVATAERVKAGLTPQQLQSAANIRKTLDARYSDAVAKPRMVMELRQGQMQMTGSHTGFDSGISHPTAKVNCANGSVVGGVNVLEAGCGSADIYANSRWDPKVYFTMRDAEWKASVSVGAVQEVGKAPAPTTGNPDPAKH